MVQENETESGPKMADSVFYKLISEISYHHFYFILLATQTNPGAWWEGTIGV